MPTQKVGHSLRARAAQAWLPVSGRGSEWDGSLAAAFVAERERGGGVAALLGSVPTGSPIATDPWTVAVPAKEHRAVTAVAHFWSFIADARSAVVVWSRSLQAEQAPAL